MSEAHQQSGLAGGVFIAIGTLGGILIGAVSGQPSIGLLAGLSVGVAAALLIWLRHR